MVSRSAAALRPRESGAMIGVAESRLWRVATVLPGISTAAYLLTDLPALTLQRAEFADWWWFPALGGHLLAVVAFLVLPFFADLRTLRIATLAFAVFGLVTIALMLPAGGLHAFPDSLAAPWPLRTQSGYIAAAAVALVAPGPWVYLGVLVGGAGVARWLTTASPDLSLVVGDQTTAAVLGGGIVAVLAGLLRVSRRLDRAAGAALRAARLDAAAEAWSLERRRAELFVHDEILYTLRAASLGVRSGVVTPQRLAASALERLDEIEADAESPSVAPGVLVERLRVMSRSLDPAIQLRSGRLGEYPLPADVVACLVAAAAEALRNSLAHADGAGRAVRRRVEVRPSATGIVVRVADDGRGFDPSDVRPESVGVRRSIVERMTSIPGGAATVTSAVGRGTVVELSWSP